MYFARVISGSDSAKDLEGCSNRGPPGLSLSPPRSPLPRGFRYRQRNIYITTALCVLFCLYLFNVRAHTTFEASSLAPPDGRKRLYPIIPWPWVETDRAPEKEDQVWKKPMSTKGKSMTVIDAEDKLFADSIYKLINNLPGEIHSRDYLRILEGTGKEKLREMGLRVRAFKDFFQVWEDVHMSQDAEGNVHLRDDVVAFLKRTTAEDKNLDDGDDDSHAVNSLATTVRTYETYRGFMAKFTRLLFPFYNPYFPDLLQLKSSFGRGGRGIVFTAGDNHAPYLLTTIPSFRALGCDLPIEVMYLGESDLSEDYRAELEALPGVITRDIAQMVNDQGWKLAGWAAKPFAMLLSSFREVMIIDADSAFFQNPALLFEDPGYRKTGALFFRDRIIMPENKKRWLQELLPHPISKNVRQSRMWTGESGHMQESGVVVVDKWRHFVSMLLVTLMNGPDRDRREGSAGVYEMMYGDKETFWIGFELAGDSAYSWHQGDAGGMGVVVPSASSKSEGNVTLAHKQNHTMCMPQLVHYDVEGKPLWFNGWLLANKYVDPRERKFADLRQYLIEPAEHSTDNAPWTLGQANSACLTSDLDRLHDFDQKELELLDGLKKQARKVGAAPQGSL